PLVVHVLTVDPGRLEQRAIELGCAAHRLGSVVGAGRQLLALERRLRPASSPALELRGLDEVERYAGALRPSCAVFAVIGCARRRLPGADEIGNAYAARPWHEDRAALVHHGDARQRAIGQD